MVQGPVKKQQPDGMSHGGGFMVRHTQRSSWERQAIRTRIRGPPTGIFVSHF